MNQYRKLIVAVVGLAVLFVKRRYGLDLDGTEDLIADVIINGLIAWGVYRVPNAPPKGAQ